MLALKKIFDFFIFSSFYIGVCAVVMVLQVNDLLQLSYSAVPFLAFVFSATVCSYNFHWLLTPETNQNSDRLSWTIKHRTLTIVLIVVSGITAIVFGLKFLDHWIAFGFAGVLTFLYSAPKLPFHVTAFLKRIAVGKTLFLTFVWTYVTAVLPIILGAEGFNSTQLYFVIHRFLLIYAICILFDVRDRESDKAEGIRSLITFLSERNVRRLFFTTLFLFGIVTMLLPFPWQTFAILLLPGLIATFLYTDNLESRSDYYFYFLLDGLMMFSGLISIIIDWLNN